MNENSTKIHKILLEESKLYISKYNEKRSASKSIPKSFRFHLDQVKELVNENEGEFFNIEKGLDADDNENIVLTVLDGENRIVGIYALQASYPCPPYCF